MISGHKFGAKDELRRTTKKKRKCSPFHFFSLLMFSFSPKYKRSSTKLKACSQCQSPDFSEAQTEQHPTSAIVRLHSMSGVWSHQCVSKVHFPSMSYPSCAQMLVTQYGNVVTWSLKPTFFQQKKAGGGFKVTMIHLTWGKPVDNIFILDVGGGNMLMCFSCYKKNK